MKIERPCLVIPSQKLSITQEFQLLTSQQEINNIYSLVDKFGEIRSRNDVETDETFQQPIMYAVVVKDNKILFYQRSPATKAHGDNRLSGKISAGIGGHMENDESLRESLLREFLEEAEVKTGERQINDINELEKNINFQPVGLIKDTRDEVGKVHFGIVCLATPKDNVTIRLKTSEGEETQKWMYLSLEEYKELIKKKDIEVEGWTDIVMRHVVNPLLSDK